MKILPLMFLLCAVLGCVTAPHTQSDQPTTDSKATPSPASGTPLTLLSGKGTISGSKHFITVVGQVKNTSSEKLDIFVVVTHFDKNGDVVATDEAITTYDPLMPGQTSPFEVITNYNPAMKRFKIAFRNGDHEELNFIDNRHK